MIYAWLIEKLGKTYFSILKWVLIALIVASPFIYHIWVVGKLEDKITETQEKTQILEQNQVRLQETNESNEKILSLIKNNTEFVNKLEQEYEEKNTAEEAKNANDQKAITEKAQVIGDQKIGPLTAEVLNNLR